MSDSPHNVQTLPWVEAKANFTRHLPQLTRIHGIEVKFDEKGMFVERVKVVDSLPHNLSNAKLIYVIHSVALDSFFFKKCVNFRPYYSEPNDHHVLEVERRGRVQPLPVREVGNGGPPKKGSKS